ncbi:MAG: YybS family protein [Proteobacteria bacterium]|nr:YybS family protein [Pseudomonadota bacterium]MBU1716279.1 YybS family protein [Pseudomonadota bacterium]
MIYRQDSLRLEAVAITALILFLPAVNLGMVWLQFFVPLPAFYYLSRYGFRNGSNIIAAAVFVAGAITTFLGSFPGLFLSIAMLPAGFVLAMSLKKELTPVQTGTNVTITLMAGWFIWAIIYGAIENINPYQELLESLDQGLVATLEMYSKTKKLSPTELAEIETAFKELRLLFPKMFPGMLLSTLLSTACLNMIIGQWLMTRQAIPSPWRRFSEWRLPENLVIFVIANGLFFILPVNVLNIAGLNLVFILGTLYFFQGLAVLTSLLARWLVPQPLKALIYFMIIIQASGVILLAITGLIDVWVDFRKPKPKKDQDNYSL